MELNNNIVNKALPEGWHIVKIRDIMKRVRNSVDVEKDSIYREIGIKSHGKGIFYKDEVTGESLGNKSVFWVEPDCFIVNIVFAWELAIAKTTSNEVGMIASHRFPMYKPIKDKLDLDFITYFFKTPYGKHLLNLASPGGAGRNKTLGQEEFLELEIRIPKIVEEQRRIASILSTWDNAIELKEMLIKQKKEQKKSLMQTLLTGKKRRPGYTAKWEEVKLKKILKIRHGKSQFEVADSKGSTPIMATGGQIGWANKYLYDKPSVLIGRKGTINKPQYIEKPFWTIDTLFYSEIYEKYDVKFIYYIFGNIPWEKYNETSGVPSLSASTIESILVRIPLDYQEQKEISDIFTKIDSEITLLEDELEQLTMQKKGLMQLLLTGKVRVKC